MADKPILFSGPMVRALLAGTKTQTRRLMPNQEWLQQAYAPIVSGTRIFNYSGEEEASRARWNVGDRLYVREHWRADTIWDKVAPRNMPKSRNERPTLRYEADGSGQGVLEPGKFRQGMHMPRWASRLTLTVTDVRVERLQDCSEEDAKAEGIEYSLTTSAGDFYRNYDNPGCPLQAYGAYRSLWEHINGSGSWDANPWVAAYTFTVEHGNIDQVKP